MRHSCAAFALSELMLGVATASAVIAAGALFHPDAPSSGASGAQATSHTRNNSSASSPSTSASSDDSPGGADAPGGGGAPAEPAQSPPQDSGYPEIRRAEIEKHKTQDTEIWVTYGEGVYDITEFVEAHPGGSGKIMLAAGGSLEPYWAMYAQHKQDEVRRRCWPGLSTCMVAK